MTISCVEGIVKKYIKQARLLPPELFREDSYTPHSFRHSVAVHMLESGIPLPVIKNFLGHSSLETTMVYATISQELRDKAVMRKLDTLVADFPNTYKLTGQDEISKTYIFPKSHISYRKPRAVSTEQRERARQMMIEKNESKKF